MLGTQRARHVCVAQRGSHVSSFSAEVMHLMLDTYTGFGGAAPAAFFLDLAFLLPTAGCTLSESSPNIKVSVPLHTSLQQHSNPFMLDS